MNILFLSNIATPYQLDFLKSLDKHKDINAYGYFLYAKEKNREWRLDLPENVYIANFKKSISCYKKFFRFLKTHKIDIIIIGGYALPMTLFAIALTKLKNKDLYFWLERPINEPSGFRGKLKEIYLYLVLRQSKKIFAISKLAVQRYQQYHSSVFNLPYSMYLDKFYDISRKKTFSKKNINFLFSGQYIERKNIVNTIHAFMAVDDPDIRLSLIGGGELENEINKLVEKDGRITNHGFIQPTELIDVYKSNDVFLMPSRHDGWALVINEAMAAGMPVISTEKVGAVAEYIEHGENGFICQESSQSIQRGIEYYSNRKHLIDKHGEQNRKLMKESLGDVNNMTQALVKELEK